MADNGGTPVFSYLIISFVIVVINNFVWLHFVSVITSASLQHSHMLESSVWFNVHPN